MTKVPREPQEYMFFHTRDWRGSRKVQRMSLADKGAYLELILESYEKGGFPDDLNEIMEITGAESLEEIGTIWDRIKRCFSIANGWCKHEKVERVRSESDLARVKKAEAGRKGGLAKAANASSTAIAEASTALAKASQIASKLDRKLASKLLGTPVGVPCSPDGELSQSDSFLEKLLARVLKEWSDICEKHPTLTRKTKFKPEQIELIQSYVEERGPDTYVNLCSTGFGWVAKATWPQPGGFKIQLMELLKPSRLEQYSSMGAEESEGPDPEALSRILIESGSTPEALAEHDDFIAKLEAEARAAEAALVAKIAAKRGGK